MREEIVLPVKRHLLTIERRMNPDGTRFGYLRLDKNENTEGFPARLITIFKGEIDSAFLTTYPEMAPLYERIAKWVHCKRENIYISAGSDAAIKSVFEVFVKPGDRVTLISPTYAMFYVYAKIFQARLKEIRYKMDLTISPEEIVREIKHHRPRLVCIANPNSPTGTIISQKAILKIVAAARRHKTIVLLDEAYYPFYPVSSISLIRQYPNIIITRSFSKAFGLASVRAGFACAHKDMISYLHKVRPMYETNSFAARFAELVLDNYGIVKAYLKTVRQAKAFLEKGLNELGISYSKSFANFMLIDVGSFKNSIAIKNALARRKILIQGGFLDKLLRNYIRVTIGTVEQMKAFLSAFKESYL